MNLLPILLFLSVAAAGPKAPSVFVSVLVRNKAHTLPYFLSTLEQLSYPKERIVLHIRSDQNEVSEAGLGPSPSVQDSSLAILRAWVERVTEEQRYHRIITDFGESIQP
jgi:collagen beta-1,O-galactosyltransferase